MKDVLIVEEKRIILSGYNNNIYIYKSAEELFKILSNILKTNLYKNVEIIKKIDHNSKYSLLRVNKYYSEFGFDNYNLRIVTNKSYIGVLKTILYMNNYLKEDRNKKLILK